MKKEHEKEDQPSKARKEPLVMQCLTKYQRLPAAAHWYDMDHDFLTGLVISHASLSVIRQLIKTGTYSNIADAINAGLRLLAAKHSSQLLGTERGTQDLEEIFTEQPRTLLPDETGYENIGFLAEMYEKMEKNGLP